MVSVICCSTIYTYIKFLPIFQVHMYVYVGCINAKDMVTNVISRYDSFYVLYLCSENSILLYPDWSVKLNYQRIDHNNVSPIGTIGVVLMLENGSETHFHM